MEQTSLEKFESMVDSHFISLKKYITYSSGNKVILEDYENYAWGKNPDLTELFDRPYSLPIKSVDVTYKERECMFLIVLTLK